MENKVITIPTEEYKELLIIKGKYEELKSQTEKPLLNFLNVRDYSEKHFDPESPYKITCLEEDKQ